MEAAAAAPLGPDDYSALRSMLTSDDASTRAQGLVLAKKLTPEEGKAFFTFQQQTNKGKGELTREDNQVAFGVPPEAAAMGAIGIARAVGGAGLSMAGRAVAGAKAAISQAAPTLKYEATKTVLEKMGVPTPLAVVAATAVSAYKGGAKEVPEEPATAAAPAASPAAASPPVAPVPPSAAAASTAVPQSTATAPPSARSPQQTLNEEALAARRAAYQAKQAAEATTPAVQKPALLASETKEFVRLIQAGKSQKEALAAIQVQRDLQAQLGLKTPTAAETRFPKGMRGKVPGDDE